MADGIECGNGHDNRAAAAAGGGGGGGGGDAAAPRHFMCDDCLSGHVGATIDDEGLRLFRERGGVCCPDPTCGSPPFSDKALASNLSDDQFAAYARAKEKLAESKIAAQLEAEYAERMEKQMADLKAKAGGDISAELRAYAIENIFTLACPRCNQVFVDFTGCFALTCSRPGCGCGFCARCLKDCGKDAHKHVEECTMYGGNGFFGDFEAVQRVRRKTLLQDLLRKLPPAIAARLLDDCAQDIEDLGLGATLEFMGIHGKEDADPRKVIDSIKKPPKGPKKKKKKNPPPAKRAGAAFDFFAPQDFGM